MALIFLFLYLPIGVLVAYSFNAPRLQAVWTGFTLDWYRELFDDFAIWAHQQQPRRRGSVGRRVHGHRYHGRLCAASLLLSRKGAFEAFLQLPIVIPEIVMGVAVGLYVLIEMPLGLHTVTIAHIAFNISFVTVVVRARLYSFDFTLEEAAMDLGEPLADVFPITLPLIAPGVAAGFLIALTLSLDDFIIAFFTAGAGSTTLPMQVYSMMRFGVTPKVNALSTLILLVVVTIAAVAQFIVQGRNGKQVPEEE